MLRPVARLHSHLLTGGVRRLKSRCSSRLTGQAASRAQLNGYEMESNGNLRVTEDLYGGVLIQPESLPASVATFKVSTEHTSRKLLIYNY